MNARHREISVWTNITNSYRACQARARGSDRGVMEVVTGGA